jgi:hypothetical protein
MNGNGYERTDRDRLVTASVAVSAVVGVTWLAAMIYVIAAWSTSG